VCQSHAPAPFGKHLRQYRRSQGGAECMRGTQERNALAHRTVRTTEQGCRQSFRFWNLVPTLARLRDIDGSGLLSERRWAPAPASIECLAGSPPGDPACLTLQNAVFVTALSDDQGHHVSLFQKESLEPTPMKRRQRTAGGVDGEMLAPGEQRMRQAVTMIRGPGWARWAEMDEP
jgi:hypothetical protein